MWWKIAGGGLGPTAFIALTASLAIAQTPPPGLFDDRPPAPISLGTYVSGALEAGDKKSTFNRHYVDEFVIEGRRGDRIVLTLRSQAFAPRISVSSATNFVGVAQPAAATPGEARLEATLPEDGRYIITASTDKVGEAGPYQLAVDGSSAGKAIVAAQVPTAPAASSVGPTPASSSSPDHPAQTQADWALWPAAPAAQRGTERLAVGLPGRMEWVTTDGLFAFVIPEGFKSSESSAGGDARWKGAQGSCSVMPEVAFFFASFRPADQTTTVSQSFMPAILAALRRSQKMFANTRPELAEIVPLAAGGAGRSLEAAFGVETTNAGGTFLVTTKIMTAAEGATFGVNCIGTADNRAFLEAAVKNIRPLRRWETPSPRKATPTALLSPSTKAPAGQTVQPGTSPRAAAASEWALWPAAPPSQWGQVTSPPRFGTRLGEYVTPDGRFSFIVPAGFTIRELSQRGLPRWKRAGGAECEITVSAMVSDAPTTAIGQTRFLPNPLQGYANTAREMTGGVVVSSGLEALPSIGPGAPVRAAFGSVRYGDSRAGPLAIVSLSTIAEGGGFGVSCYGKEEDRPMLEAAVRQTRVLRRDVAP